MTSPSEARRTRLPRRSGSSPRAKIKPGFWTPFRRSLLLGLLGFLVSFAGSWVPSPWLDEAATAHIISYSLADMAAMWQHTDVVFAPYYILMNAWTAMTGITPVWLRLPSLMAVGAGTAAMAAAGGAVGGPKAQVLYAACFALLPRVTAMGIEARPYALSAMFMAFALLSFVKLRQGGSGAYWLLLALSMIGSVSAQFFSALPVLGLAAVGIVLFTGKSRLALLAASAGSALVCLPLAAASVPQQAQVSWIADSAPSLPDQALVEAWFTTRWSVHPAASDIALHQLAVTMAVLAGLTAVLAVFAGRPVPKDRLALALVPPAAAVGVLWGVSLAQEPMLLGRYLTSSTPFAAMLLAECLMSLRPPVRRVMVALLLVGCSLIIAAQRQPYAKVPAQDYSFIASVLGRGAESGDGLLIEPGLGPPDSARNAMALYPQQFSPLVDLAQPRPAALTHVFAVDPPLVEVARGTVPQRVWLVSKVGQNSSYAAMLSGIGYEPAASSSGPGHTVTLWNSAGVSRTG